MSDGVSVFECTSDDEVIDLLRGGQGSSALRWAWCGAASRARWPSCRPNEPKPSQSCTPTMNSRSAAAHAPLDSGPGGGARRRYAHVFDGAMLPARAL